MKRWAAYMALAAGLFGAGCTEDTDTLCRRLDCDVPRDQVAAVATAVRTGNTDVIPALIEMLRSEDEGVRFSAEAGLRRLTGEYYGVYRATTEEERAERIALWEAWWEREGRARYAPGAEDEGS